MILAQKEESWWKKKSNNNVMYILSNILCWLSQDESLFEGDEWVNKTIPT